MKKLLTWTTVSLLTSAMLDPLIYSMLEKPIPWLRDIAMGVGGIACFWLLVRYHNRW